MNERIRKFSSQSQAEASATYAQGPSPVWLNEYNKKFAELIVRECARTASMFSVENKRIHPDIDPKDMPLANQMVYHSTCQCVAQEIKEHFGVE